MFFYRENRFLLEVVKADIRGQAPGLGIGTIAEYISPISDFLQTAGKIIDYRCAGVSF